MRLSQKGSLFFLDLIALKNTPYFTCINAMNIIYLSNKNE
jgi:hypothetical protein